MKAARQQAIVDLLITHSSLTTETLSNSSTSAGKLFAAI